MDNYGYPANTASSGKPWGPIGTASTIMPSYPKDGTERVLVLDTIARSVAGANEELSACIALMRDCADSVFGPNPPDKEVGLNAMPHTGRIDGLSRSVNSTHELISALRSQIERFRNL